MSEHNFDEPHSSSFSFPQAQLRISATFPASDGYTPEQVEVEFGANTNITTDMVCTVIAALAQVPQTRFQPRTTLPTVREK